MSSEDSSTREHTLSAGASELPDAEGQTSNGGPANRRPTVCVIGAGVAGLTAAHELSERGFEVWVYDRTPDPRRLDRPRLGGLAASQFRRGPIRASRDGESTRDGQGGLPKSAGVRATELIPFPLMPDGDPDSSFDGAFRVDGWPTFPLTGEEGDGSSQDGDEEPEVVARLDALPLGDRCKSQLAEFVRAIARSVRESRHDEVILLCGRHATEGPGDLQQQLQVVADALKDEICPAGLKDKWEREPGDSDDATHAVWKLTQELRLPQTPRTIRLLVSTLKVSQPPESSIHIRMLQQLLPGEHGYRFFPSFYSNLFDTLRRIPLLEAEDKSPERHLLESLARGTEPSSEPSPLRYRGSRRTVFDELESVEHHAIAMEDHRPPLVLPRANDFSIRSLVRLLDAVQVSPGKALSARDLLRVQLRVLRFMTSSEPRRRDLETVPFLEYLSPGGCSAELEDALRRQPKALVGLRADVADARTFMSVMVQLGLDQLRPLGFRDGTLAGATSEVWFDPWQEWLEEANGVQFRVGELTKVDLKGGAGGGVQLTLRERGLPAQWDNKSAKFHPQGAHFDYVIFALDLAAWFSVGGDWREEDESTTNGGPSPLEFVRKLVRRVVPSADGGSNGAGEQVTETEHAAKAALSAAFPIAARAAGRLASAQPDPSQSSPDNVGGATTSPAGCADSSATANRDGRLPPLPFRQYAGIQFFLSQEYRYFRGHTYYPDSAWSLSSISQMQFRTRRPRDVMSYGGILSVIIGDWDAKGGPLKKDGKTAWQSTPDEIAAEVWRQITAALDGVPLPPEPPRLYHLDEAIVDSGDARFCRTPFLVNDVQQAGEWPEVPGRYRLHFGDTTAFCGTWLATRTSLVTMESANESGRHAANAVLRDAHKEGRTGVGHQVSVYDHELAEIPDLEPLRRLDAELHSRGLPHFMEILQVEQVLLAQAGDGRAESAPGPRRLIQALHEYVQSEGRLGAVVGAYLLDLLRR